jgi:release factor glutamine methyltransferase
MNYNELKHLFNSELKEVYPVEECQSILFYLLEEAFGISKAKLLTGDAITLNQARLMLYVNELKAHKPIQYVLGKAHFHQHEYSVNEGVLIPRPETEELVEWIINDYQHHTKSSVLDLCTGSGCIAIELALHLQNSEVSAIDFSPIAIATAQRNAQQLQATVSFSLENIFHYKSSRQYDVIVSNPPYVTDSEKMQMRKNVVNYEPHSALFVEDTNPLMFYKQIAEIASKSLHENGSVYLEINEAYAADTAQLFKQHGFENIELRKDLYGKDRMMKAKKNN